MKIVSAIKWAIKKDAISSTYSQGQFIGDYGEKKLWKIYQGSVITTRKKVAIFVLSKSSLKIYAKENREYYLSLMAKSIEALERYAFPTLLKILAPFTETKDSYCFVTEPVIGTLEDLINSNTLKLKVIEDKFKFGIYSLATGLQYLNHSQLYLQCLVPSEILISPGIRWKIGGAFFLSAPTNTALNIYKYNDECPSIINISYGYVAPENLEENGNVSIFGDVFSFGSLLLTIFNSYYQSGGHKNSLIANNCKEFQAHLDQFKCGSQSCLRAVPSELSSLVMNCLEIEPSKRSSLDNIIHNKYFNNINLTTLTSVDFMPRMTKSERKKFLLSLQNILNTISHDTITTAVIPMLLEHMYEEEFTIICIKTFIPLVQICDFKPTPYVDLSQLKYLVETQDMDVLSLIIEHMELFCKYPETTIETNYDKIICKGLQSNHVQCQKLAMDAVKAKLENKGVSFIATYTNVIPSIGHLLKNNHAASVTHISAFISLAHSLTFIDYRKIEKFIFPILFTVTNTEVSYLMSFLGLVQSIYDHQKDKMDSEMILTKLNPVLQKMVMHPCFNQTQVKKFKNMIYKLMDTAFNELVCIRPVEPSNSTNFQPAPSSTSPSKPLNQTFSNDFHIHDISPQPPNYFNEPTPPTYREPPASEPPNYNKQSTPNYNKQSTPSYNKQSTPSYNKQSTPSYNKQSTPSYNKQSTPSYNNKSSISETPNYNRQSTSETFNFRKPLTSETPNLHTQSTSSYNNNSPTSEKFNYHKQSPTDTPKRPTKKPSITSKPSTTSPSFFSPSPFELTNTFQGSHNVKPTETNNPFIHQNMNAQTTIKAKTPQQNPNNILSSNFDPFDMFNNPQQGGGAPSQQRQPTNSTGQRPPNVVHKNPFEISPAIDKPQQRNNNFQRFNNPDNSTPFDTSNNRKSNQNFPF